jgi:NADPH-dependent 2,4-dienoyl-CoA reductase/sulfur reductase-like enzyme
MPDRDCDVAVVGAGPAGLAAANAASARGARVLLIDENVSAGGQIWRGEDRSPSPAVEHMFGTRALCLVSPGILLVEDASGPVHVRFGKLVIATGARERFLPFPGWTLPGVFGAGGLQALVKSGLPIQGKRVVVGGTGPLLIEVAAYLQSRGARVLAIAEQASRSALVRFLMAISHAPGKAGQAASLMLRAGRLVRPGTWVTEAHGRTALEAVTLTDGHRSWREDCDYLACGFHLVPNIELAAVLGCRIEGGFVWTGDLQETSVPGIYCAGEPTGIGGVDKAIVEGEIAARLKACPTKADNSLDQLLPQALRKRRERARRFQSALDIVTRLRPEVTRLAREDTIVCRCEDVPFGRIREHADWRSAKLLTRCGMGPCQGRVCGGALEAMLGWRVESVRPPVQPARIRTLAVP